LPSSFKILERSPTANKSCFTWTDDKENVSQYLPLPTIDNAAKSGEKFYDLWRDDLDDKNKQIYLFKKKKMMKNRGETSSLSTERSDDDTDDEIDNACFEAADKLSTDELYNKLVDALSIKDNNKNDDGNKEKELKSDE
jgi:hypothetical protein